MICIDAEQLQDGLYNIKNGKIYKYRANGGTSRVYKLENRPQEWIPCSERLPEEDGDYLVSLAFEWGNEIEMGWLLDGEWVNPNSHVTVAWQPLPKPWKGVDDE